MKHLLLAGICGYAIALFSITGAYAQIKGDPKMKGKIQQLAVPKTSSKVNSALKELHDKFAPNPQNKAKPKATSDQLQNFMQLKGDKVLVDFTAKGDINAAKAELQQMGVTITAVYGRVISGFVPISILPRLENARTIRSVKPSYKPMHQSGLRQDLSPSNRDFSQPGDDRFEPVISQGDTAQWSYLARKKYHVTGKDVKVGILSDSYNNLGTAHIGVKHGELPGRQNPFGYNSHVQVISELDSGGIDEGRAMMEIIHDVAPDARLAFHTAYNGQANFAQGIQTLANKGCNVIVDDISYLGEPFFQDGIIAQSINMAKKKGGYLLFFRWKSKRALL